MSDVAGHLNWLAIGALRGENFQDAGDFVDTLCELLRSDTPITVEVREELAQALQRGKHGYRLTEFNEAGDLKPRLMAEGFSSAKMRKAVRDRRRWLDAGEELYDARLNGASGDDAVIEVGRKYGLGFEAMRKNAVPFFKEFMEQVEAKDGWLTPEVALPADMIKELNDEALEEGYREMVIEDGNSLMKSYFCWAKADQSINGLDQPRHMNDWQW
ncbi:hypothetical protein [Sphingobium yanoikuyae]|uniref:hypothetical protein n=1 Tax=Sphingobium yanoikuyae TaxID=13690 RepID=UPI0028AEF005|nr:hypothetical protein [Sphingobium yanoikuyae]